MSVWVLATPMMVLILLGVALVGVALTSWRRRQRSLSAGEPGCGACGYSTRGLTTLICPECGNDLRRVGITTAKPIGRGYVLFAMSATLFTLVAFIGMKVVQSAVWPMMRSSSATYTMNVTVTPRSDATRRYAVKCTGPTGTSPPVTIETFLEGKWVTHTLTFDPATGGYSYAPVSGPPVNKSKDFGPEAVLDWMKAIGIDTSRVETAQEAARLAGLARKAGRVPDLDPASGFGSGTSSSSGGSGIFTSTSVAYSVAPNPRQSFAALVPAFWLVLWIGMMVVLWKSLAADEADRPAVA